MIYLLEVGGPYLCAYDHLVPNLFVMGENYGEQQLGIQIATIQLGRPYFSGS